MDAANADRRVKTTEPNKPGDYTYIYKDVVTIQRLEVPV